jgi:hypothetical protein
MGDIKILSKNGPLTLRTHQKTALSRIKKALTWPRRHQESGHRRKAVSPQGSRIENIGASARYQRTVSAGLQGVQLWKDWFFLRHEG